jgi:hypothetical protein
MTGRKRIDYGVMRDFTALKRQYGATQGIAFGGKGSGKTTLLTVWTIDALQAGQTCIWRGREVDTWNVFHRIGRCLVLLPKDAAYRWTLIPFDQQEKGEEVSPENLGLEVVAFASPADALEQLDDGRVNVVLTLYRDEHETHWWMSFVRELTHRPDSRWIHLVFDEVDDVIPANPQGVQYHIQKWMVNYFKDLRKRFINLRCAVHHYQDIDHRILTKFHYRIYLRGASRLKNSPVRQRKINRLRLGEGIIDSISLFQDFSFRAIPKGAMPGHLLQVEPLGGVERQNDEDLRREWRVGQRLQDYPSPAGRF